MVKVNETFKVQKCEKYEKYKNVKHQSGGDDVDKVFVLTLIFLPFSISYKSTSF